MSERISYQGRKNVSEFLWDSKGEIDARDTSVDLVIKTSHPSFVYETHCFEVISHTLRPDQFAIGPHLVDFLFEHEGLGSRIRPDGIIFSSAGLSWKITSLIEIRTGKLGLRRKLAGFSSLLSEFRQHPHLLPGILKRGIGDVYDIPDEIIIPGDEQVAVLFVHPKERKSSSTDYVPYFSVQHRQIRMSKLGKNEENAHINLL